MPTATREPRPNLVEMNWDPITRIVGSLGIYTKIDFGQRKVAECHSTSSIFRGYSIFMKGKDPRDAHFITSRICGICGDNHAHLLLSTRRTWRTACSRRTSASGSSTSARPPSTCSTTTSSRRTWSASTSARRWCARPIPGVWEKAAKTEAPHAAAHGYRTIGDIMKSLNPFEGEFYREALQMSRMTREMFCLMEGRHVHPSTLYPGRRRHGRDDPAVHRLPDPADEVRRVHEAGRADARRSLRLLLRGAARLRGGRAAAHPARLLGLLPGSRGLQLRLRGHDRLGPQDVRHPGRRRRRQAGDDTTWWRSTSASASCSAARSTTTGRARRCSSTHDPLGNPVDRAPSLEPAHDSAAAEARLRRQVQLGDVAALVRRQGSSRARHRRRSDRAAVGDGARRARRHRLRQGDRQQRA